MDFKLFKNAVAKQFATMMKHDLFVVEVEGDALWDTYLKSFPEGTNPIYRERTEHDCSCCKNFIRAVGRVVALIDGQLVSIWDGKVGDPNYQVVSDALAALVKSKPISNLFFHFEPHAGVDKNFEQMMDEIKTWEHFHVEIPARFVDKAPGVKLSEAQASHDVLKRGLDELTLESLDTVLELIGQNSLYRGEEHRAAVEAFRKVMVEYQARAGDADLFVWSKVMKLGGLTRFRNTAIGTLAVDLSAGVEMEGAVKSFESKVAPTNYKRPTALVTKQMVEQAKAKIEELGLTSALERRYANINDVTINNVLFANRDAKKSMAGDVFDDITSSIPSKQKFDKVEEVSIEKFLSDILPGAKSIELMPENKHTGNLVSLIAPANPTARKMFKWDNAFSWSYSGEMADSIKERVKAAGGNVTGDVCCRLAWNNRDDLDFHMKEPSGHLIYFGNRRQRSPFGGVLDVDANGADGQRSDPAENIYYAKVPRDGQYELKVHQYSRRSTDNPGFTVEIDVMGTVYSFLHEKSLTNGQTILVATIVVKNGVVTVEGNLPSTQKSKEVWNINTNTFVPVSVVMMSPNYWDGQGVGNKHYFFMLDGCLNDGKARGFFNEFLVPELDAHRKVIEIVGSKMRTEESDKQLSGLGFSSTQRNSVLCRVNGAFSRVIKLTF